MTYIKTYKELIVWQKAVALVTEVYSVSDTFPKTEVYGLVSQMRRASVSIPCNIAEGYGRKSSKEYSQFYAIAYGSSLELETQIIIGKNLHFATNQAFLNADLLLNEVQKMLFTMTYTLKEKLRK